MDYANRQWFLDIAHFKRQGELCLLTPTFNDFWPETVQKWVQSGISENFLNSRFRSEFFQFYHCRQIWEVATGLVAQELDLKGTPYRYLIPPICPTFEPKILSEDEHTFTLINHGGQKARVFKNEPEKMPMYLDHPVKDRATWQEYKKRLDPFTPERYPLDWDAYVQRMNSRDEAVLLYTGGFFGFLREWMGTEKLLYLFYDDPVLVEDMMEHICNMEYESIKKVVQDIRVDYVYFWEDMAFKTGSLISPAMFRKYMLPRYKKVTDLLRSYGVDVIVVDSDGNIDELIPLWLEGGVNGFWPLECAAGMNAVNLSKKYGKDAILFGNIDKRALMKDKKAMREEVMSKVPYLMEQGGYFPTVDHQVPPDVPFENYLYFVNTLREITGLDQIAI